MRLIDVGDRAVAVLVDATDVSGRVAEVRRVADAIARAAIPGLTDAVCSPGRVTVVYDPLRTDHAAVRSRIESREPPAPPCPVADTAHEIPVCHGGDLGPDIDDVGAACGLDRGAVVAAHTSADYVVESIGFLPGFAYLAGLPRVLATPRRATPRRTVPAGSVGIGGGQTGVYPFASPGGWNIIGATPTVMFDAAGPRPATLAVGDRVRFTAIDRDEFLRLQRGARRDFSPPPPARGCVSVLAPGLFTTVQDLGRPGHRSSGVPTSGAADEPALRLANLLVGNPATAAGLEITLVGPTLRFDVDVAVAVTGASFPGVPAGRRLDLSRGDRLVLGHAVAGCRGYLAIAGGIDVPEVLGSRSTFVPARLGGLRGLPLAAGDVLPVGDCRGRAAAAAGSSVGHLPTDSSAVLRMIPGEMFQLVGDEWWSRSHVVTSRSDRMGVRLDGRPFAMPADAGSGPSVAVLTGGVQLPPDGRPILLLADAQTVGGYPVVGQVITADLPVAAQLRPGDAIRWRPATIDEAHAELRARADRWGCGT